MKETAPVKNTSGGGFRFETIVGGYFCAAMLAGAHPLGASLGALARVDFQTGADGWLLDDQLLTFGGGQRVAFSVKSNPQFGNGSAPADFVRASWELMSDGHSGPFDLSTDQVGLVVADLSSSVLSDIRQLRSLALVQDLELLDQHIETPGYVSASRRKLWKSFGRPEGVPVREPLSKSPGEILSRFQLLDVGTPAHDSTLASSAIGWCREILVDPDLKCAQQVWDSLLVMVDQVRVAGGFLDQQRLFGKFSGDFALRGDRGRFTQRLSADFTRVHASMVERWLAVGLSETVASAFADDTDIGSIDLSAHAEGVVVIEGEFGAGKTLAAERAFLADVELYRAHATDAVPVLLRARDVVGSLELCLNRLVPTIRGDEPVRVVVDGLDWAGRSAADQLLNEARVLCRSRPGSRVLFTSRPLQSTRRDERVRMPALTVDEIGDLARRVSSEPFSMSQLPAPVKDVVEYPLFALIYFRLRDSLPRGIGRAGLIDALVKDSLGGSRDEVFPLFDELADVAQRAIPAGGWTTEADLGGPDFVESALRSRLLVLEGNRVRFALPIFEQYFGAHALLRRPEAEDAALSSLSAFEDWRYAFVVAVGIGAWERVSSLLAALGSKWPGAAQWVLSAAVPERYDSDAPVLSSADCAARLRLSLATERQWLQGVDSLTGMVDGSGSLLTVVARSGPEEVHAALVDGVEGESVGLQDGDSLPEAARVYCEEWSRLRAGHGWPWRWASDRWATEVERVLRRRLLPTERLEPLFAERQWVLARRLVDDTRVYQFDLDAEHVRAEALFRKCALGDAQRFTLENCDLVFELWELDALTASCSPEGPSPIRRPWPTPDIVDGSGGPWRWNAYSPAQLNRLAEAVYAGAIEAYEWIVTRWFPRWAPTMTLASLLPVEVRLETRGNASPSVVGPVAIDEWVLVLPSSEETRVVVGTSEFDPERFGSVAQQEWDSRRALRPSATGWASVRRRSVDLAALCGDMPATDVAYGWIWDDLHDLGFLRTRPPQFGYG